MLAGSDLEPLNLGLGSYFIRSTDSPDDQPTLPSIKGLTKMYSPLSGVSHWLSRITCHNSENRGGTCGIAVDSVIVKMHNHLIIDWWHSDVTIQ